MDDPNLDKNYEEDRFEELLKLRSKKARDNKLRY